MDGLKLWEISKTWNPISENDLEEIIQKSLTKKYMERPSPKFPAGKLCGVTLKGNDGNMYISVKSGSFCVWIKQSEKN